MLLSILFFLSNKINVNNINKRHILLAGCIFRYYIFYVYFLLFLLTFIDKFQFFPWRLFHDSDIIPLSSSFPPVEISSSSRSIAVYPILPCNYPYPFLYSFISHLSSSHAAQSSKTLTNKQYTQQRPSKKIIFQLVIYIKNWKRFVVQKLTEKIKVLKCIVIQKQKIRNWQR